LSQKNCDIIGIPNGTRLQQIVLCGDAIHVWIAIKCRNIDYNKWQGTYLQITPSKEVTRVTIDDALPEYEDIMLIKKGNDND
jgi:hypothetical protein